MLPSNPVIRANRLLTALPGRERRRFLSDCRPVELVPADVLVVSGERIRHVYFPIASFISQTTSANGIASLDVGLVGDEGMIGTALVLGVEVSPLDAVVQGGGLALRMDVVPFRRQLDASPALHRLLNRYAHVLMGQLAQTAACTRFHMVEGRLARLLLMTQDRAHSEDVQATHEVLAGRLGVRRAGVTMAATALQRRGLIRYRRGDVTILDRRGLENSACDCYAADNVTYARAMGKRPQAGETGCSRLSPSF